MQPDSTPSAANLSGVSLSFGDSVHVLENARLSVAAGETAALTGPSGAGKTSLLAIIGGLLRPTAGKVEIFGQNLGELNEEELAQMRRENIGVVFQHFHLLETMTAHENAALTLQLAGRPDAMDAAAEALSAVGLAHRMRHFPSQLSGGEQQRTAIARAFAAHPKLLLADEPTGNLDHDTGREVLDALFSEAKKRRTAMLFVTHNDSILDQFDSAYSLREKTLHAR